MKTAHTLLMVLGILLPAVAAKAAQGEGQQLIVIGPQASPLEQLAAKELQRYLWQVSGMLLEISSRETVSPGSFLVGLRQSNPLIERLVREGTLALSAGDPGPQGYLLKQTALGDVPVVVIAGGDAVGCLYGVYGLLEDHFGLSFGLAGDVLPDEHKLLDPAGLDERHTPAVPIRGLLPWSNFPQSTTSYSWADWKFVIDQMAKMRMNLLMVHNYNGDAGGTNEMYHNFPVDGKLPRVSLGHVKGGYMIGGPAWVPWEYRFGGRDLIDDCDFGAEAMLHGGSLRNEELFARGVTMFQRVIAYAHTRGVKLALGTDINYSQKGFGTVTDSNERSRLAHDPELVKSRIGQVIRDYPDLDYFVAFCWEGMPQFKQTAPLWERTIRLVRRELQENAPQIKLAVSGWGMRSEYIDVLPDEVICAPIAPYSARPQDGTIFGRRDYWACPWMEKDNDSSMFYYPYRLDLSESIDAWQKRTPNTGGLYALTWRNTDAIDAKLWYIAHAPWDSQNRLRTSTAAYHAYAVANYGPAAADAVTPIIDQNEAFASNMCEMGGPRPFREFATIMFNRTTATFKAFGIPAADGTVCWMPAVRYDHRNGGRKQKDGTPDAYVDEINSGLWLIYRNVDFGAGADRVDVQAASVPGARVEIRLRDADGPVLGQAVIPKTAGWEKFQTVSMPIRPTSGVQTICVAFGADVYPRKELAKAERQLAVVDRCMAKASPGRRQRLDLLRTRLAAVRDHIRLMLEFPEYTLADLPGAMDSWVMNYIRRVDDISSLGTLCSIEGCYVQHTYLREKVKPFYNSQKLRPPMDVEARGTLDGAEIRWQELDGSGGVYGYRLYRDGKRLTMQDLPASQTEFVDHGSGEFCYTVTAVGRDGRESLPSVKSRCLAGAADREPPWIVMVSPPLSGARGQAVDVKARVVDGRAYACITAALHYRRLGTQAWQTLPMTRRVRAIFTATLRPEQLGPDGVEYYIEASDGTNTSRFPLAAPRRNLSVILESGPAASELAAPVVHAAKGTLAWQEAPGAYWYRIYRGRTADFSAGPHSYLTYVAKGTTGFTDLEEDFDGSQRQGICYYRLTTMDRHGFENAASPPVAVASKAFLTPSGAVLAGGVRLTGNPASLSGTVAGWFANPGDQILFQNVPAGSGLAIRYSNGNMAAKRCGLYVQGKRVATFTFPVTAAQGDQGYVNGVRFADAAGQTAAGDWNTFAVLAVEVPVQGDVALRIDREDAEANRSACCNIDRLEVNP
jgi:hypothetical protein